MCHARELRLSRGLSCRRLIGLYPVGLWRKSATTARAPQGLWHAPLICYATPPAHQPFSRAQPHAMWHANRAGNYRLDVGTACSKVVLVPGAGVHTKPTTVQIHRTGGSGSRETTAATPLRSAQTRLRPSRELSRSQPPQCLRRATRTGRICRIDTHSTSEFAPRDALDLNCFAPTGTMVSDQTMHACSTSLFPVGHERAAHGIHVECIAPPPPRYRVQRPPPRNRPLRPATRPPAHRIREQTPL